MSKINTFNMISSLLRKKFFLLIFFTFIILLSFNLSFANGEIEQFDEAAQWILDNIQGGIGKTISAFCLLIVAVNIVTNPRLIVIMPLVGVLVAIWVGPSIINSLFS